VKFWDSSAIVPLLVLEEMTAGIQGILRSDPEVIVWWGTGIECVSAIARLERAALLEEKAAAEALRRMEALARAWHQVEPVDQIREAAKRFLRVHDLRAADACQLAAAFAASEGRPSSLPFVCLDDRLASAAGREGFPVLGRDDL
jgi:predicted nucleic acid-binding protein